MTVGYVDSSCLVAIAFAEPGHELVAAHLARHDQIVSSNLLEAEYRSALSREGVMPDGPVPGRISWAMPHRPLSPEIQAVLEAGQLRGADLWHLACALYISPDPHDLAFLTLNLHQAWVAASLGFPTMQMPLSAPVEPSDVDASDGSE